MTGAKYKQGRSRTLQLENHSENGFSRFFDFEKVEYGKYRITEIYETPLPIKDKRSLGNSRGVHKVGKSIRNNLCFDIQDDNIALSPGVYKIENDDSIYIGSTTKKLTDRFSNHFNNHGGTQEKTQNVLLNNGKYTYLEYFDRGTDEQVIRDAEAYYIWKYQNCNKEKLNDKLPELLKSHKEILYDELKIPINLQDEVLEYLRQGGFLILGNTMYDKRFNVE